MNADASDLAAIRGRLQEQGVALFRFDDGPVHSYPYDTPWLADPAFNALYDRVRSNTLVDRTRCHALYQLLAQLESVPGQMLEVGTWRGGTAGIIASQLPDRTLYVADTFTGVVKSSPWEHYQDGAHSDTSVESVQAFLTQDLELRNVVILQGVFPDESGGAVEDTDFCFVHIDVDVFESARDVFLFAWERLSANGVVVFDDYGFRSACPGVTKLVDSFRNHPDKLVLDNLNGHAYVIKRTAALPDG